MIFCLAVSAILMSTGLVLLFMALRHRAPDCPPLFSFRLKNVKPFWKQKEWFTPKGYRLYVLGAFNMMMGGILGTIYWYCKWQGLLD